MVNATPQPDDLSPADAELLELYLDGQLTGTEAERAEGRIAEVPKMQAAVEKQDQINRSLKQHFVMPEVSDDFLQSYLHERAAGEQAEQSPPIVELASRESQPKKSADLSRQRRSQWLAALTMAACLMVWGTFGWGHLKSMLWPENGYDQRMVAQIYEDAVDSGFKPDWLCEDDQEFAQTFAERQGQGLLLEPLPEGARMAGLAYLEGFSPKATSMFAYVDEQPVLLMVGRTKLVSTDSLRLDKKQNLNLFKRQLGDLTIVEITPLDEPRIMHLLTAAEVPESPTGHVPGTRRP